MSDMHQCSVCKEFYNRESLNEVGDHWERCWDGPAVHIDKPIFGKKVSE